MAMENVVTFSSLLLPLSALGFPYRYLYHTLYRTEVNEQLGISLGILATHSFPRSCLLHNLRFFFLACILPPFLCKRFEVVGNIVCVTHTYMLYFL